MRYSSLIRQIDKVLSVQNTGITSFKIMTDAEYICMKTHEPMPSEEDDNTPNMSFIVILDESMPVGETIQ